MHLRHFSSICLEQQQLLQLLKLYSRCHLQQL
jgi:hypothetical protein